MVIQHDLRNWIVFLIFISFILGLIPTVSAEYSIDISPLTIAPDQEVTVALKDIPQNSLINMSLNASVKTTPGQEMDYTINNFLFPYESGVSVFQAKMMNLEPGTPATVSILREDGTEATRTDNVSKSGEFNASIQRELNRGMYNVSFIGIPASTDVKSTIDFGGMTNTTTGTVSAESYFSPGGITDGTVDVKIYIDNELQKSDTITISSKA
jgi:hypothetical protein